MIASSETLRACVDHILQSGTFGNAPSSRRLLKYARRPLGGRQRGALKEYAIGVDAFAKAPGYDPRQDSTVRIQIGRLRQKLAEYYRDEGGGDTLVIDLPKGQFTLTCEPRPVVPNDGPARDSGALSACRAELARGGHCARGILSSGLVPGSLRVGQIAQQRDRKCRRSMVARTGRIVGAFHP